MENNELTQRFEQNEIATLEMTIKALQDSLRDSYKKLHTLRREELLSFAKSKDEDVFFYDLDDSLDTVRVLSINLESEKTGTLEGILFSFSAHSLFSDDDMYNRFEMGQRAFADLYAKGSFSKDKYLTLEEFKKFKESAEYDVMRGAQTSVAYIMGIDIKRRGEL